MVALPLGSQLTMDANLDMSSRTPVAATATPSRSALNSYEAPNRGGVRQPARLVTAAEIRGEAHLKPEIRVTPAGAGRPSQLNLQVSKATTAPPTTPTRPGTRQGFAAPPANGNLTPKVTQRPVGTRGSGGNVTPVSSSTAPAGGVIAPSLAADSRPQPKYITEEELEARLKAHTRQVQDMLKQFCQQFEVGLERQAAHRQEAEGSAQDVTSATAMQQLNSRCEKVEAALSRLEMQLQATSISNIRQEDRLDTTAEMVYSHTQSIEELRKQLEHCYPSQDTAQKLPKRDLPVVHEQGYCVVEAPAGQADEAAGSPVQEGDRTPRGVLARATAVTSVSSSPYPAGSHGAAGPRVGQRAVPSGTRLSVPTGPGGSDSRSAINFPSFDELGAPDFLGLHQHQQQPAPI